MIFVKLSVFIISEKFKMLWMTSHENSWASTEEALTCFYICFLFQAQTATLTIAQAFNLAFDKWKQELLLYYYLVPS